MKAAALVFVCGALAVAGFLLALDLALKLIAGGSSQPLDGRRDHKTQRPFTPFTTVDDLYDWHRADRPQCYSVVLTQRVDGYACRVCGWVVRRPFDP